MANVNLEKWRGKRDPQTLEPETMAFVSKAGRLCKGCLFNNQWASVCQKANEEAAKRQIAQCESGVVYVDAPPRDPRQLEIKQN